MAISGAGPRPSQHRPGTTPRYLSFVETGRARPGRDVVLRLARALDLPVREQNALLSAAGLPPAYAERGLDEAALLRRAEKHAHSLPAPEPGTLTDLPVICPRLRINGQIIRTITTVMRFDTAVEVNTSELRVELMFPADEASDQALRALLAGAVTRFIKDRAG